MKTKDLMIAEHTSLAGRFKGLREALVRYGQGYPEYKDLSEDAVSAIQFDLWVTDMYLDALEKKARRLGFDLDEEYRK